MWGAVTELDWNGYRGEIRAEADGEGDSSLAGPVPLFAVRRQSMRVVFGRDIPHVTWTVATQATTATEAVEQLYEAELLLVARVAERWERDGRPVGVEWFRLVGGELAGMCKHPEVVPVDTLWTRERVGWLCADPLCGAQLPADWR